MNNPLAPHLASTVPAAGEFAREPSLRRNAAWSFAGNVTYAASQWAILVVIARLTSPVAVGQFALGIALTAPVVMLLNLQLRAAQATDARGAYQFSDYLALRLASVVLTLLVMASAVLVLGYRRDTALVVLGIALAKCAESISDVFHGLFQRHQRMELIARSAMGKGLLSLSACWAALFLTHELIWGVAALVAAWTVMLLAYDIPQAWRLARHQPPSRAFGLRPHWRGRTLLRLVGITLPLGLAAMLMALNATLPRYFVEHLLGERSLGIFAALAYFVVAGSTAVAAVGESAMPRLANLHAHGNVGEYMRLLGKLLLVATGVGLVAVAVTLVGGNLLLEVAYGPEYAAAAPAFVWIMVAGLFTYLAIILGDALLAARRFFEQLILLASGALVMVGACVVLIPQWGLSGAAFAILLGAAVNAAGASVVLFMGSRR